MKYYNILPIAFAFIIGSAFFNDIPLKEYEKVITESYDFDIDDPKISLDNRYGDVEITSHNQQTASVRVEIIVEASKESRAQEIFDRIDIDMSHSSNRLSVKTDIGNSGNWNWTKQNEQYKINYTVSLPSKSFLSIANKYGNISCTDHDNDVDLILKYGNGTIQNVGGDLKAEFGYVDNFTAGMIAGDADIDLSYSDFSMESAEDIEIYSKYSEFNVESAQKIISDSKYDKYRIGSIQSITNEGKYDNIRISDVSEIKIETKYTNIKVGTLSGRAKFSLGYGDLTINEVRESTTEININSSHTGCSLAMSGAYELDVDTKYVDVDYPRGVHINNREKDGNELLLQGYFQKPGGTLITAHMKYGHLRL